MVQYKVTLVITDKLANAPRRGERESIRYRVLKSVSTGPAALSLGSRATLATLRSVRVRRVA